MGLQTRQLMLVIAPICAALVLNGCSVIGFFGGYSIDSSTPDEYVYTPKGLDSIELGSTVQVLRTDSRTIEGEYGGLKTIPDTTYAFRYREFLRAHPLGMQFPAQGAGVRIVTHGALGRGEQNGIFICMTETAVRMHSEKYGRAVGVSLKFIDTLHGGQGSVISGDTLRRLKAAGDIPLLMERTDLVLASKAGTISIPIELVSQVRFPRSHYAKWYGLGVGALVDILIWKWMSDLRLWH